MSDTEDARAPVDDTPDLVNDGASDDLFGDESEAGSPPAKRTLDDPELDSGDDLARDDRVAETVESPPTDSRPLRLLDADIPRINYPLGSEFYLVNMPAFLGARQENYDPETYQPPSLPHDGDPTRQTSAFSTAMSSLLWRHDPQNPENLQSNARIIRWSDGSLTLQLSTKPTEQYRISTTAMRESFGKKLPHNHPYDPSKDSHTFLTASLNSEILDMQLVRSLDATMKIMPSGAETDESNTRLAMLIAQQEEQYDPLARMKETKEDPEFARKAAEQFEKDRMRAVRKRENAEERLTMKRNQVLGRSGLGRSGGGGLSVAGLEDDMGMPVSRGTKSKAGAKKRKTNRRGEIYSDDEDDTMPRGRTREDEYDREDDFLADSDEEPEIGDGDELLDDEEEDDGEEEEQAGRQVERRREGTPQKRKRMDEIDGDDDDDDAEGEPDDELLRQSPQVRKARRVIDDDDEE